MKKMTAEELAFAFEVLADEKHHSSVFRASERIRQHVLALEADVAQARERALEEAAERCDAMADMADGHSPVSASADRACADAVRALKSTPAQEANPDTTGEADQPLPCGPVEAATDHSACPENCARPPGHPCQHVVEMASEENGLLPKKRLLMRDMPCQRPGCGRTLLEHSSYGQAWCEGFVSDPSRMVTE